MSAVIAAVRRQSGAQSGGAGASLTDLIENAQTRARERSISYRGLLTPEEAWAVLQLDPATTLIDIRTTEELNLIGRVPGAQEIQWKLYPDWRLNPDFLTAIGARFGRTDRLLLLCRSGIRSREAAEFLNEHGYLNVFNVLEGFEGDKNASSQRVIAGWKARGLPWSH